VVGKHPLFSRNHSSHLVTSLFQLALNISLQSLPSAAEGAAAAAARFRGIQPLALLVEAVVAVVDGAHLFRIFMSAMQAGQSALASGRVAQAEPRQVLARLRGT
jgi:hypothetical protein